MGGQGSERSGSRGGGGVLQGWGFSVHGGREGRRSSTRMGGKEVRVGEPEGQKAGGDCKRGWAGV